MILGKRNERIMKIQIGENIKRFRPENNITQEALAEILGVSCAAVSKWEVGDTYPDITLIFPLADFFGAKKGSPAAPPIPKALPYSVRKSKKFSGSTTCFSVRTSRKK